MAMTRRDDSCEVERRVHGLIAGNWPRIRKTNLQEMAINLFLKLRLGQELLERPRRSRHSVPYHVALTSERVSERGKHWGQVLLGKLAWASSDFERRRLCLALSITTGTISLASLAN